MIPENRRKHDSPGDDGRGDPHSGPDHKAEGERISPHFSLLFLLVSSQSLS